MCSLTQKLLPSLAFSLFVIMDDRITDRPLIDPKDDDFQRAPFAARLADILLAPSHTASIVVGLYGKWGEGKSTVLNFIEHKFKQTDPAPVVIHLNPWRFPDEGQLLLDFFKQLTSALGQGLYNSGEKIAEAVTKYVAPLIPTLGFGIASTDIGKSLQAIGNVAQPSLEELHRRVDQAIVESGKRVVVIVDDLDRLEKKQVQAVFRLVKLTANFRHTAYLLAFDEGMVARAIGEIFAPGGDATSPDALILSAGKSFLEKIIQVPLRLPRARQQALLDYCIARIEEALTDTNTELDSEEARRIGQNFNGQRFGNLLRRGVLPRLTTPRLAIRYANAIRFSLPLLRDEVNTVDLLLIEALGVFYPELHQFIADHQGEFAGSHQKRPTINLSPSGEGDEPDLTQRLKDFYKQQGYSFESRGGANILLAALFPRLANEYDMWASTQDPRAGADEAELNRLQSVAAPNYFSRYFSYSVASGDVSDQEFNAFLQENTSEQIGLLADFSRRIGTAITLDRIDYRLPELTAEQSRNLFLSLVQSAELYKPDRNWNDFNSGEISKVVQLLLKILTHLPNLSEREQLVRDLLSEAGNFELAYQLDQQLQMRYETENRIRNFHEPAPAPAPAPLFPAETWESLLADARLILLNRALREAESKPLYLTHPVRACKLLTFIWPQLDLPPGPVDYLLSFLQQYPADVVEFLKVCGQRASVGNGPFYQVGLGLGEFDRLRDIFGESLYNLVRTQLGDVVVEKVDFEEYDEPTPEQRLKQFVYLYEHRLKQ